MYYLLTESFKEQHKELVRIIQDAHPAEKIYFLGSTLMNRRTESIFSPDVPSCRYIGHYYVLVLVRSDLNLMTVQDKIENNCRHFIPVTAIVLDSELFNAWLHEGHRFACIVGQRAVLLYGAEDTKDIPFETPDAGSIKVANEKIYNEGLNMVTEFIAGADLYHIREQNKMAAFMLHQAAEHALHTILKIKAGLYINTHNLDKLIRYCTMVAHRLPEILPRNNEKNERLFQLLNKAYVETRYKNDYGIDTKDLLIIMQRTCELQDLMKDLCKPDVGEIKSCGITMDKG